MDQPYRAPRFNERDLQTPAEIEQARLQVARGRRVFIGLVLVAVLLEIGIPLTGWRHPSGLRTALSLAALAGIWLGSRRVLILAMLYWSFLAVATAVLCLEEQPTVATAGLATSALYGLMAFTALLSESLSDFVRYQHQAARRSPGEPGPDDADSAILRPHPRTSMAPATARLPIVLAAPSGPPEPRSSDATDDWPLCPQCRARRTTRCPICRTAGADFAPGDAAFSGQKRLVICPTCDEPFAPEHARRCEWCGHEFADGFEPDPPIADYEPMDWRPLAAIAALLAILGGMAVYVATLF